jgi:uncharacterized membrane protein YfcA
MPAAAVCYKGARVSLPDFPPLFYPVAIFAILLTGVSKSGFGGGAAGIAVPLMSMFVAPPVAAAIMLPILCAMDVFGVHAYRGRWAREHLAVLLPGALVGIVVGAFAFGAMSLDAIRIVVGGIAVVFALNRWLRVSERIAARLAAGRRPPGRVGGAFWGAMSGFTSTLAHAGGPPFVIYMLAHKPDKTVFVATSVVFFLVVNYTKLVPYYVLGQLNLDNLAASLVFAPLAPIGVWLGVRLHRRLSERVFYEVTNTLLFASGAKLVWDAFA